MQRESYLPYKTDICNSAVEMYIFFLKSGTGAGPQNADPTVVQALYHQHDEMGSWRINVLECGPTSSCFRLRQQACETRGARLT